MLLGLKTDNPVAELYLYGDEGASIASYTWRADRELAHWLLKEIDQFVHTNGASLQDVKGLFVFQGPGSFTGLRIGLTVMDTLAYALHLPIVAAAGDNWRGDAVARLLRGDDDEVVLPLYGAEARITQPKK